MAQIDINNINKVDKDRNIIHDKVYTTFSSFDNCGVHYVQIDTYGRSNREQPGKISQSIQFDRETASYLVDLLKREFEL